MRDLKSRGFVAKNGTWASQGRLLGRPGTFLGDVENLCFLMSLWGAKRSIKIGPWGAMGRKIVQRKKNK